MKKQTSNLILNIGICGAFDFKSYGDLLFPLIAEKELTKRLGAINIHPFSYHKKSPPEWCYKVTSLTELPEKISSLDGVLIGGGHIIRFDKFIPPGYLPSNPDIHYPTGFWLIPILLALQYGIPVVWNAPGVFGELPAWATPLVEMALKLSDYVSVRDEWAKEILAGFSSSLSPKIALSPDTAFAIANLFPFTEQPSKELLHLLHRLKINRPYILIQPIGRLESFITMIKNNADIFDHYQIIILPVSSSDDISFINALANAVNIPIWPEPLLIAEIISKAAAVIGSSLHLTITALAYNVPIFRPIGGRKYKCCEKFQNIFYFDNQQPVDPKWFNTCLNMFDSAKNAVLMQEMVEQTNTHWDRIATIFKQRMGQYTPHTEIAYFWQSVPILLEAHEITKCAYENKLHEINALESRRVWRFAKSLHRFLTRYSLIRKISGYLFDFAYPTMLLFRKLRAFLASKIHKTTHM